MFPSLFTTSEPWPKQVTPPFGSKALPVYFCSSSIQYTCSACNPPMSESYVLLVFGGNKVDSPGPETKHF